MNETCTPGRCAPVPRRGPAPLDAEEQELAELAKALAHPARVRILRLLIARSTCVCGDIVEEIPLAQSTVSQHLAQLRDAGLIQGEIDGPRTCYCVNPERLRRLRLLVAGL